MCNNMRGVEKRRRHATSRSGAFEFLNCALGTEGNDVDVCTAMNLAIEAVSTLYYYVMHLASGQKENSCKE